MSEEKNNVAADVTATAEEIAAPEDAVVDSTEQEKELEEIKSKYLRLHADFDNFRKRTQKEKEEWYQYAAAGIMEKLLPVLDNFERALEAVTSQGEEVQSLLAGLKMIYRQLVGVLEKEGLEPIIALGEIFDPNLHEAMLQVPLEEGQQDNQVVEELRKGYRFKERVIRPTLAKVAKD